MRIAKAFFISILAIALSFSQGVREFSIIINPDSLLLLYSRNIWDKTYVPMRFVPEDGSEHAGGIRFKGHSSRYYPKKPFTVKFNKGQEFEGWREMGFNAMYTDKSLMREELAWQISRKLGIIGPETYYANLYINGKNYGLYLFVERIDETFKRAPEKYGFMRGGSMYEPVDDYHMGDLFIPPDSSDYFKFYDKKFPADSNYSDLIQLIKEINETPAEDFHNFIERKFIGETVLNWFLLNTLSHMGDTYNKNYYLYHDSVSDKWLIIPWDYDLSFGRDGTGVLPYPLNLLNDKFKYWYMLPYHGVDNPLKIKFFQNSILVSRFKQKLDSVLTYIFTENKMLALIDSLKNLIRNYVYRDEFKWGTNKEFDEQVEALKYYVTARRFFLYKWLSNYWPGEVNKATLRITRLDTVYHFVDKNGRLLGSIWFYEANGLDSLTVIVYPDSISPYLPDDVLPDKYVRRVFKIIPYPSSAKFRARIRLEYRDESLTRTELGAGILDEHFLKLHYFDGQSWKPLETNVNSYANTLTVDNVSDEVLNENTTLSAFIPVDYKLRWSKIETLSWDKLLKIKFANKDTGYVVGETSSIFITKDGGRTWLCKTKALEKELKLNDVAFTDSLVYIVGEQGLVYKGKIGDTLWTQIELGTRDNFKQIGFYNGRYGFIRGESEFYYTSDAGNTWQKLSFYVNGETEIKSEDTFASVKKNSIILWRAGSNDSVSIFVSYVDTSLRKIKLYKNGVFYVVASDDSIYVVKDTIVISRPLKASVNDIKIIDSLKIFVACDDGIVLYTKDGGNSWHLQPIGVTNDIYSVEFIDSLKGFAVGNFGLLLSTEQGGYTKVIFAQNQPEVPAVFKLHQNYPNPFNSSTKIYYEVPYPSEVKIEVYDILGRKVATLVDGYKNSGIHFVDFNAVNLASGVYFYVMKAKNIIISKKMVLLK